MTIRTITTKGLISLSAAAALIGGTAAGATAQEAPEAESDAPGVGAPAATISLYKLYNGTTRQEGTVSYNDSPGSPDDGSMIVENFPGGSDRMEAQLFWDDDGRWRPMMDPRMVVPEDHTNTQMAGNPPTGKIRISIYYYDSNGVWEGIDHVYGYNAG